MKGKIVLASMLVIGVIVTGSQFGTLTNNSNGAWYSLSEVENSCLPKDDSKITSCLITNPADLDVTLISENDWDYYGDDGDVKYAYSKWSITRNGSVIDQSDWNKINISSDPQGETEMVQNKTELATASKVQGWYEDRIYFKQDAGTKYYDYQTNDVVNSNIDGTYGLVFGNFTRSPETPNALYGDSNKKLHMKHLNNGTVDDLNESKDVVEVVDQGSEAEVKWYDGSTSYYSYEPFDEPTLGDIDNDGTNETVNVLNNQEIEVTDGSESVKLNASSHEVTQDAVYFTQDPNSSDNTITSEGLYKFTYDEVPVTANATTNHKFDRRWDQEGEYSYTVTIAEAKSNYYTENDTWSDYEITEMAEYSYPFEIVRAGDTPSPVEALQNWFDGAVDDIINTVNQLFEDNPTKIPDTRYN